MTICSWWSRENFRRIRPQGRPRTILFSSWTQFNVNLITILLWITRSCTHYIHVISSAIVRSCWTACWGPGSTLFNIELACFGLKSAILWLIIWVASHKFSFMLWTWVLQMIVSLLLAIRWRALISNRGCHGTFASWGTSSFEIGCCTGSGLFLACLFHLIKWTLCKILQGLNSIKELSLAQSSICIQVHSSNYSDKKRITCIDAALNKETLQVWGVDEAKVAVIEVPVARVKAEVVARCQILLQHLDLACQSQLFLEQFRQAAFNIVWQELVGRDRVGGSLWGRRSQILLVAWKQHLKEAIVRF